MLRRSLNPILVTDPNIPNWNRILPSLFVTVDGIELALRRVAAQVPLERHMPENTHDQDDPLGSSEDVLSAEVPAGVDRRTFFMRSAVIGATVVMTGIPVSAQQRAKRSGE